MKRRRIGTLFGIRLPVIQGGMLWLADAELAAAVLKAGALGVISPFAAMPEGATPVENFTTQIQRLKRMGLGPVAVNIPLDLEESGLFIDQALTADVDIVITAAGDPALFTGLLNSAGIITAHVVASPKQARRAEDAGVAAVIASGYEAAAHIGFEAEPLISLIPRVVDAVAIPVVAAGGIADGRGMAAALALGAEGVQVGTRFVATVENPAHEVYKTAIIEASRTVVTCRSLLPTRSLETPFTRDLMQLEASGAGPERLQRQLGFRRSRQSQLEGDPSQGELFAGAGVGLIHDIPSTEQVVADLIKSYNDALARLTPL